MNHNSKIFEPLQVRNTVFRNSIFGAPILPFSMLDDHLFHRMITAWVITKRTDTADLYVPSGEEEEEE